MNEAITDRILIRHAIRKLGIMELLCLIVCDSRDYASTGDIEGIRSVCREWDAREDVVLAAFGFLRSFSSELDSIFETSSRADQPEYEPADPRHATVLDLTDERVVAAFALARKVYGVTPGCFATNSEFDGVQPPPKAKPDHDPLVLRRIADRYNALVREEAAAGHN